MRRQRGPRTSGGLWPPVLALATLVALAGCRADGAGRAPEPGPVTYLDGRPGPHYDLVVDVDRVRGLMTVTSNGLPVWREPRFVGVADNQLVDRLGPGLVSGRNVAAFRVQPQLRRGGPDGASGYGRSLVVPDQRFALGVWSADEPDGAGGGYVRGTRVEADSVSAAFGRWEAEIQRRWPRWLAAEDSVLAAGGSGGEERDEFGPALRAAWAWAAAHPFEVATSWNRSPGPGGAPADGGPAFDRLLRAGPVIGGTAADSARLRAYAARLLALERAGDRAALADEYRPAFEHGVDAQFPQADGPTRDSLLADAAALDRDIVDLSGADPFAESDVALRSWAGGRVWELYRPGQPALLRADAPPPEDPGALGLAYIARGAYVAEVGGRLRVVRFGP